MIEIKIDIDEVKLREASRQELDDFMTARFELGSIATSWYGAEIIWDDPLHWIVRVPEQHAEDVRKLLNP
jgi:hypothetical protein